MKIMESPTDLVGEPVNAICFVMDYVELRFNGPILRALTAVEIALGEQRWVFPEPGSRDALSQLIGATLTTIDIEEERSMDLSFDAGYRVTIPLSFESRVGPEAAHFVPGERRPIQVW
jgi:hypothetical protein